MLIRIRNTACIQNLSLRIRIFKSAFQNKPIWIIVSVSTFFSPKSKHSACYEWKIKIQYSVDRSHLGRWEIQARLSLGIYRMDSLVSCVSGGSCVLSGGEKGEKKCILKKWNSEHRIQAIQHSLYKDMGLRFWTNSLRIKAYKKLTIFWKVPVEIFYYRTMLLQSLNSESAMKEIHVGSQGLRSYGRIKCGSRSETLPVHSFFKPI